VTNAILDQSVQPPEYSSLTLTWLIALTGMAP
jgi:hypothetical protein